MHSQAIQARSFLASYADVAELPLDVMLEVKDKNLSALKCLTLVQPTPGRITGEWARCKYAVLERDHAVYGEIRRLLRRERPDAAAFYGSLEAALAKRPTPGETRNAAEYVWEHLRRTATAKEMAAVFAALEGIAGETVPGRKVKNVLRRLVERYAEPYWLRSLYLSLD